MKGKSIKSASTLSWVGAENKKGKLVMQKIILACFYKNTLPRVIRSKEVNKIKMKGTDDVRK
jgi:hypothetical protein